jgi:hypothetical protein
MGKLGFGEKRNKFQLREVKDFYSGKSVFDGEHLTSNHITQTTIQEYAKLVCPLKEEDILHYTLQFETPARFVENKKDVIHLTPDILLDSMIRRYKTLHQFYGEFVESDLELGNLQLTQTRPQKYSSWKRYSNRQGRTLEQGGILGSYALSPLRRGSLLCFCIAWKCLHVGKSTTFGLGKVRLEGSRDDMDKAVNGG